MTDTTVATDQTAAAAKQNLVPMPTQAPAGPPEAAVEHDDIEAYRKFVSEVAAAADGRVIFNRSRAHAAVIMEHLFGSAHNEVNILTGQLFETVYGNESVRRAAVAFLQRNPNSRLNIISERPLSSEHPLLKAAASVAPDRVRASTLKADVAARTPFHFAVADGRSLRFEAKKAVTEAVVQFGAPETGQKLNKIFHDLQARGTKS